MGHRSAPWIALSLLLGCGAKVEPPEPTALSAREHLGVSVRSSLKPRHVSLTLEGLSSCDEALLEATMISGEADDAQTRAPLTLSYLLSPQDLLNPPVGLNVQRFIKRLSSSAHSLSLRLAPSRRAAVEHDAVTRDLLLYEEAQALTRLLQGLDWRRARPLPKLWRSSHFNQERGALDLNPQEWLAHDWVRELTLPSPQARGSAEPIVPPTIESGEALREALTQLTGPLLNRGGVVEVPRAQRCALAQALGSVSAHLSAEGLTVVTIEELLAPELSRLEHPRLARFERPPISEGCAQLLGLKREEAQPALAPRWALIINELSSSDPSAGRYLTLPLPWDGQLGVPSWETAPSLRALWERRHLWWGASGCLQSVPSQELLAPLSELDVAPKGLDDQARGPLQLKQLSAPFGVARFPTLSQLSDAERAAEVPVKWRGLLHELWPARVTLSELDELFGVTAYYTAEGSSPSAALLTSARPLTSYRLLAHLTGEPAFTQVAYQLLSFAGPIVMLPSLSGWRAPLKLSAGRRSLTISPEELKRAEGAEAAWQLVAALPAQPQLKLSHVQSVYRGRARLKRALKLSVNQQRQSRSGELWFVDGGRLGQQRLRLMSPPGERGLMGDERGW